MQKTDYQVIDKNDNKKLADFLCQEGQLLLPMVELITEAEMAVDELIDVVCRATIEAVMALSVQSPAPPSDRLKQRCQCPLPELPPQTAQTQSQLAAV